MARRFTTEEKGKASANIPSGPPRLRMRAPDFDPAELIKDNLLTLVGRLTNPREQKMSSVLPYLAKTWNLVGASAGSDLGNGCFQFRLNTEEDIRKVLHNRPYQYGRWMIIVQRWEPIISHSFPFQIPFWISLRGIPLHYWHEKVVSNIGMELGELETYEVTKTSARVRVRVDGLKPLIMEAAMDFNSGEESIISLDYEKLGNHCSFCYRLSHLRSHCPERPPPLVARTRTDIVEQPPSYRQEPVSSPPRASQDARGRAVSQNRPFQQRLDRHGRPFGDRVSSAALRPPGPKNKIAPRSSLEREKTPTSEQREPVYTYPPYTRRRLNSPGGDRAGETRREMGRHSPILQWRPKSPILNQETTPPSAQNNIASVGRNLEATDFPLLPTVPSREEKKQLSQQLNPPSGKGDGPPSKRNLECPRDSARRLSRVWVPRRRIWLVFKLLQVPPRDSQDHRDPLQDRTGLQQPQTLLR
ncbi:Uncharacterized protein Rs2_09790 [Raphanus sativus]|nr:Uncharacterized protein Rs2_09790 [Raphanus sativus]